jgi:hypothetical protein
MLEATLSASAELSGDVGTLTIDALSGSVSIEMSTYLTGPSANVSNDTGNMITYGLDGGLYVMQQTWGSTPDW